MPAPRSVIPDGVTDNDINQHPCSWQVADTIDAIRDRVIPQVAAVSTAVQI